MNETGVLLGHFAVVSIIFDPLPSGSRRPCLRYRERRLYEATFVKNILLEMSPFSSTLRCVAESGHEEELRVPTLVNAVTSGIDQVLRCWDGGCLCFCGLGWSMPSAGRDVGSALNDVVSQRATARWQLLSLGAV